MARNNNNGLPENAHKVFDGIIFDVYQWEQKMFDGTTAVFEKLKRADTGEVIAVTKEKKIIMLKQEQPGKPPFIGIPGGRLEEGEDPVEGTRRELREETGYDSSEWELYYQMTPFSKMDWTLYCYVARGCEFKGNQSLDSGEKIEIELVDFDRFIEIVLSDEFTDPEIKLKVLKSMVDGKIQELKDFIIK
jgi:ADP-ribose pyrophosphatase